MAYFTARDDEPAEVCQARVRDCDVYVGLIGLRYGTAVRDRPQVSYTELEFDTATEAGKPRLVFVLDEDTAAPIPPGRLLDRDPGLQARQRAFRAKVLESGVLAAMFATPEQLEVLLLQALQETRPATQPSGGQRHRAGLPAAPDLVGREAEVAALVGAWLEVPPRPVAVLGAPGIGKSSICLAALHDPQTAERFGGRRWFVRCDGATSAEALLSGVAAELGVIGDGPGDLADRVTGVLGAGPGVVVLDNFETPWAADPVPVEELLRSLAAVPGAGVAVTSRGAGRPAGLRWADSAMVSPLPLAEARRLFLNVAGPGLSGDPGLDGLLGELDGVPLAVELLGYAAQGQPIGQVAVRWRRERTGMLQRMGGDRPELSVAVSIEASIRSPLMTGPGRRLLSLLGALPDGIAHQDLEAVLPDDGLAGAAVLRQLGLVFDEGDRLRTLAPIREHIAAAHPAPTADLDTAVGHYAQLAASIGYQVGTSEGTGAVARLQGETGNITTMLTQAATDRRTQELADAVRGLAEYWRFTGATQPQLARTALEAVTIYGIPVQQAATLSALGLLALDQSDHDTARDYYQQALALYQQAGSVVGEANCIFGLGEIARERSDYDTARDRYQQALPLYQQAAQLLGEANCIRALGDIARERSDHDTARDRYQQALPLYQQAGDVIGEANCIFSLGEIALDQSDYDTARDRYQQALPLYQQAEDVLGEANCIQGLGDIARERSDHGTARDCYQQALSLYQAVAEPYSIGQSHIRLARLCPAGKERSGHWTAARQAWASIGRGDLIESDADEFDE
jgi:tetratricopeptide (TPR) repeat protein